MISLFFRYITNECTQDCRNYIMQYTRDFARDDCARNISEEKSTMCQGLICTKILLLHVLHPYALRTLAWACNPIKNPVPWPETAIFSCDTGQRIPYFDSCQLITTLMSNIKDVTMVTVLLSYFSRNGAWRTDVRTQSCDNQIFLRSMELRSRAFCA